MRTSAPPSGAMRPSTVHVGAMPFPTVQGTQAAVGAMVEALAGARRDTALLTYGHGLRGGPSPAVRWHRLRNAVPVGSLRSGPTWGKVALDAQLVWAVRRLARTHSSTPLWAAHHVEACTVALAAGVRPLLFVAHTALGPELPTYHPRLPAALLRSMGCALEGQLARRADAVAAVCPSLARHLTDAHGVPVHVLAVPWPTFRPPGAEERAVARSRLGLAADASVALYAGNLDAYQGWQDTVEALANACPSVPSAHLLVATASDPRPLRALARRVGVGRRVCVASIHGEDDRRMVHAAADLALIPRRTPGGLPIKLLDALGRGLPAVATRRAAAGLRLQEAALTVEDDEPQALARAWRDLAAAPARARALGTHGRDYVRRHHGRDAFVDSWDAAAAAALRSGLGEHGRVV